MPEKDPAARRAEQHARSRELRKLATKLLSILPQVLEECKKRQPVGRPYLADVDPASFDKPSEACPATLRCDGYDLTFTEHRYGHEATWSYDAQDRLTEIVDGPAGKVSCEITFHPDSGES